MSIGDIHSVLRVDHIAWRMDGAYEVALSSVADAEVSLRLYCGGAARIEAGDLYRCDPGARGGWALTRLPRGDGLPGAH